MEEHIESSGRPPSSYPSAPPDALLPATEATVDPTERARVFGALFPGADVEPIMVGRFELLQQLGRGGMGEVYVAYDARLDRRVAIKLLLHERSTDQAARERMLREAQVLARLSHPNVVQIYEAGTHDGQVFMAMELVDGVTLRKWLAQLPEGATARPWTEVLPVMIEAGRGLAAAHAAGLTHRDFKPDNVLVGSDGRVRVLDFGLARPGAEDAERSSQTVSASGTGLTRSKSSGTRRGLALITEPGQIVGTLAYMSPEQLAARPLDGRTDQFSFCVALFEALYGTRPFPARTMAAYLLMVTQGTITEPTVAPRVPRWLRALVRRGLSARPEDRFTDMESLLRELSRARGRRLVLAVSASALLLGGVGLDSMLEPRDEPCAQADAELAARWNDDARESVREAFVVAAPSYGAEVAEHTITALDSAVEGWRLEQVDACEDTRVRQTHTEELLSQRAACIDRNTVRLRTLLTALTDADAGLVEHAHEVVRSVPEAARCQDLDALGPDAPDDPEAVGRVREALAEVAVLRLAGHQQEALARADQSLAEAEATGYGPIMARALVESALSRSVVPSREEHERASQMLWRAFDLAEQFRDEALRFEIWLELLDLDRDRGRYDRARLWAQRAEAALRRRDLEPVRGLELALRRGKIEQSAGDLPTSEQWLRRGLFEAERIPGSRLAQAQLLEELGTTLRGLARGPEARDTYEQAEEQWRSMLGPQHPYLAQHDYNLGLLLVELGDPAAGRERITKAHARWTELYGPAARLVGRAELALANLDQGSGALDDALAHTRRAQMIFGRSASPDDPVHLEALQMLGLVHYRRDDLQAAHDAWEQAVEQLSATREAGDPELLLTRSNLAEAVLGLELYAEAHAAYEALLPEVRAQEDRDPLLSMLVRKGLGSTELAMGRAEAALPHLKAGLALCERLGDLPLERADLQWTLARAEHGAGEPLEGVLARATDAATIYEAHGQRPRAQEIRTWLSKPSLRR